LGEADESGLLLVPRRDCNNLEKRGKAADRRTPTICLILHSNFFGRAVQKFIFDYYEPNYFEWISATGTASHVRYSKQETKHEQETKQLGTMISWAGRNGN